MVKSIKTGLLLLLFSFTLMSTAQERPFELLGELMTDKEFRRFDYKVGSSFRKFGDRKRLRLFDKRDIESLKKIALFKYQDELNQRKKLGNKALKGDSYLWFLSATELGDLESKYNLGIHYLFGYGVEKDIVKAFTIFNELLESDFSQARQMVGYYLYYGEGAEKDINKGSYLILAEKDSILQPFVHTALGEIYLKGQNIEKDTIAAVGHFFESIQSDYVQDIFMGLLYSNARSKVIKKLTALYGNSHEVQRYLYRENILRNKDKIGPQVYYDYAQIVLRTPSAKRTWEETQKALDYHVKYKTEVDNATNEDDWYYGYCLYYKNYLRGDIYLAKTGVDEMEKAASKNHRYARTLSDIYRNSAYQYVKNPKKANYWELKADLYDGSNSEVSKIIALATGNGMSKNTAKAYNAAKTTFKLSSPKDEAYDALYYLYYSLCNKSNVDGSSHCESIEQEYAEYIYCSRCEGVGKITCLSCDGTGRRPTYRSNTEPCRNCNGFGYLSCKANLNLPKKYILEAVPSNYESITHAH